LEINQKLNVDVAFISQYNLPTHSKILKNGNIIKSLDDIVEY